MSIGRPMDKEVVVYIYNGILLSYKKTTFESVLMRWMRLEPIIQSGVSQKEKHKYCIIGSSFIHLIRTDSNTFLFTVE